MIMNEDFLNAKLELDDEEAISMNLNTSVHKVTFFLKKKRVGKILACTILMLACKCILETCILKCD